MYKKENVFVYELLHEGRRVYIGVTNNPELRLKSHYKWSNLLPRPLEMNILETCPSREVALEIEFALHMVATHSNRCRDRTSEGKKERHRHRKTRPDRPKPMAWPEDDESELFDMYQAGESLTEMSKKFGRTDRAIRARISHLLRQRGLPQDPQIRKRRSNLFYF